MIHSVPTGVQHPCPPHAYFRSKKCSKNVVARCQHPTPAPAETRKTKHFVEWSLLRFQQGPPKQWEWQRTLVCPLLPRPASSPWRLLSAAGHSANWLLQVKIKCPQINHSGALVRRMDPNVASNGSSGEYVCVCVRARARVSVLECMCGGIFLHDSPALRNCLHAFR